MAKQIIIRDAHEVEDIAEELIPEHHTHLQDARIRFLFTNQKRKKCDRVRLGSAKKLSSLERFLSGGSVDGGHDFLVLVDSTEWSLMSTEQKRALVDHELCHCWLFTDFKTMKTRWGVRGHDVEEFTEVLNRHGFWKQDLQQFVQVARQLELPPIKPLVPEREKEPVEV